MPYDFTNKSTGTAGPGGSNEGAYYAGLQGPVSYGNAYTGLTDTYKEHERDHPAQRQVDPYMENWANQAGQNQQSDRQQLADLYAQLQAQAAGGSTPQQRAMVQGYGQAAQNQNTLAQSARGGAYGRTAAGAALTQNVGTSGAVAGQQLNVQKQADQMNAQKQMLQVSTAMRAQDLQAQGMTAEDAMNKANLEAQARGMNIDYQEGWAGLEGQGIQGDWNSYVDAGRRGTKRQQDRKDQKQQTEGQIMQGMSTGMAMMSDTRAKKDAAFTEGVKTGASLQQAYSSPTGTLAEIQAKRDALAPEIAKWAGRQPTDLASTFNPGDYTELSTIPGQGKSFRHNATGAIVGQDNRGNMFTIQNGPDRSFYDPRDKDTQLPHNAVQASKNETMQNRLKTLGPKSKAEGYSAGVTGGEPGSGTDLSKEALLKLWHSPMSNQTGTPPEMVAPNTPSTPAPVRGAFTAPIDRFAQSGTVVPMPAGDALTAENMKAALNPALVQTNAIPMEFADNPYAQTAPVELGGAGIPVDHIAMMNAQAARANGDILSDEKAKQRAFQKGAAWMAAAGGSDQNAVGALSQIEDMQPIDRYGIATRKAAMGDMAGAQQYAAEALKSAPYSEKNPSGLKPEEIEALKKLTAPRVAPPAAVSPHATSPANARQASDALLNTLGQSQSVYTYKGEPAGANPRLGIMAQDLEKTPAGGAMVKQDPRSGLKYIDAPAGLSAAFAGLGRLNERVSAMEPK